MPIGVPVQCRLTLRQGGRDNLRGRQDPPDHVPFYARFPEMPFVSISNAQRAPLPRASFVAPVYTGCRSICIGI